MTIEVRPQTNDQLIECIQSAGQELIDHAESIAGDTLAGGAPTCSLDITVSFVFDGNTIPTIKIARECVVATTTIDAWCGVKR